MSNELITDADEKTIRACAWQAVKKRRVGFELQDFKQAAREALLRSIRDGRMPTEPAHRERFVFMRCKGAMVDLYRGDAIRSSDGKYRDDVIVYADVDDELEQTQRFAEAAEVAEFRRTSTAPPERIHQMRQAVDRLARLGSAQLLICLDMLAAGHDAAEVAVALGVSPSRISLLKAEARELVACCL